MTRARTFASTAGSIVQARRYTLASLAGVEAEVLDSVAVMVTELATNSVRHANTDFTISIEQTVDRIRVAVTDSGDRLPSLRSTAPTDRSGRGLQIVDALADSWGVAKKPDGNGKSVWFEVSRIPGPHRVSA